MTTNKGLVAFAARFSAVVLALLIGACATIDPELNSVVSQVRNATTPEDHLRLAERYEQDAATARAHSAGHRRMQEAYRGRAGVGRGGLELQSSILRHCENLINQQERAAVDYEGLASLHRRLADEAKN